MKNKITNSSFWMCIWLLFGITVVQAQSGSRGNTYIFGGGHATVHGGNHNFVNGGSGTQPGIVGTARTTPAGNLAFMPGTTWSGAANDAHVDGYVRSYQTGAFTFPIGDNGSYRPAAVSAAFFAMASASLRRVSHSPSQSTPVIPSRKYPAPSMMPPAATTGMVSRRRRSCTRVKVLSCASGSCGAKIPRCPPAS